MFLSNEICIESWHLIKNTIWLGFRNSICKKAIHIKFYNYQLSLLTIEMASQRNSDFTWLHKYFRIPKLISKDILLLSYLWLWNCFIQPLKKEQKTCKKIHNTSCNSYELELPMYLVKRQILCHCPWKPVKCLPTRATKLTESNSIFNNTQINLGDYLSKSLLFVCNNTLSIRYLNNL